MSHSIPPLVATSCRHTIDDTHRDSEPDVHPIYRDTHTPTMECDNQSIWELITAWTMPMAACNAQGILLQYHMEAIPQHQVPVTQCHTTPAGIKTALLSPGLSMSLSRQYHDRQRPKLPAFNNSWKRQYHQWPWAPIRSTTTAKTPPSGAAARCLSVTGTTRVHVNVVAARWVVFTFPLFLIHPSLSFSFSLDSPHTLSPPFIPPGSCTSFSSTIYGPSGV